jgi:hypothetical protein
MRRADLICAALLVASAVVVAWEGLRLGIGWSSDGPQAGFFVFYLGLALGVAAGIVVLQAVFLGDVPLYRKPFVEAGQLTPVAKVLVPASLMVLATHFVGLYVAGAVYLAAYMRWIGRHSWVLTIVLAVLIPLVTFMVFELWFLVPMPKGPLETFLGY